MQCLGGQQTADCLAACAWLAAAVLAQRWAPGKLRGSQVGSSAEVAEGPGLPEIRRHHISSICLGLEGSHSCGRIHSERHAKHQQGRVQQSNLC